MQVKPRRKELPLIEGQVPKDAGDGGHAPNRFQSVLGSEPLQVFVKYTVIVILCSFCSSRLLPQAASLGFCKRFSHDLSCNFSLPWEVQYVWHCEILQVEVSTCFGFTHLNAESMQLS